MRLFIAVNIPEEIKEKLSGFMEKTRSIQQTGIKYVERDNWHITLKFIGETPPQKLDDIRTALSEIAFGPFPLECCGIGNFPERGNPRVIWSGIEKSEPLVLLTDAVDRRLSLAGFPRETRCFSPHLTIARIKTAMTPALHDYIKESAGRFFGGFTVDSFSIYKSDLTKKGPIYSVIEKFDSR